MTGHFSRSINLTWISISWLAIFLFYPNTFSEIEFHIFLLVLIIERGKCIKLHLLLIIRKLFKYTICLNIYFWMFLSVCDWGPFKYHRIIFWPLSDTPITLLIKCDHLATPNSPPKIIFEQDLRVKLVMKIRTFILFYTYYY